jgi:hypothetical protein
MKEYHLLAVLEEKLGGSRYHRVKLPLTSIDNKVIKIGEEECTVKVTFKDSTLLSEEDFKENDMIYFNWSIQNGVNWISTMAQQHNVKVIQDVDDFWMLPKKHIQKKVDYSKVPLFSSIADGLVVATNRLALNLSKINDNICINYNDLPVGEGQFQIVDRPKNEGKVRIGICGSVSHLHDYQSIKNNLKQIAKDRKIKDKCKFVLCGYVEGDKYWNKIVDLFTFEGFELELCEAKETDSYMELYSNIDILLAPLSPSEFAECKSSLKIMEASLHGIVVIASGEYERKEVNNCLIARKSSDYYKLVKQLVESNVYYELGKELSKETLNLINFDERIKKLTSFIELTANKKVVCPDNLKMYSITYDNNQFTEYENYDNSHINTVEQKSYLFEVNPIIDIIDNKIDDLKDDDYLGILSWKYSIKMNIPKPLFYKMTKELMASSPDVINVSRFKWQHNYLAWTEVQHPGFLEIFEFLCAKLGLKMIEPTIPIHSNYFIAKKDIYVKYVNEILKPAVELLETDEYLVSKVFNDANYPAGLSKEGLKKYTGLEHYTYHTFVLERLFSVWIENNEYITINSL